MEYDKKRGEAKLSYTNLLYEISVLAGSEKNIDLFFQNILKLVGESMHVNRCYIFKYDASNEVVSNTYEWTDLNCNSQKENLQNIPERNIRWWSKTLKNEKVINFNDISDIDDQYIKDTLKTQDIKSILVVPLFVYNNYFGFLGVDQCTHYRDWCGNDINLLISLSTLIAQASMRDDAEKELKIEREQLLSIFDNLGSFSYVADMETYEILYANTNSNKYFTESLVGKICYEALQGKNSPCDFCTNHILKKTKKPYEWDHHNPTIGTDFHLIDRTIRWPDGRNVRFELAIDITERKQTEKNLFSEKERLKVTLLSIGDGVITTDNTGRITMLNKVAEELTGWNTQDASGMPLTDVFNIINKTTRRKCENPVDTVLKTGKIVGLANHTVLIAKDFTEKDIGDSAAPIKDTDGNIIGVVLVFRDVTQEVRKKEAIEFLSSHDSVTGIFNRSFFEQSIKDIDKENNLPISLIMGDVNGLKMTNDIFGHQEGDQILKSIASIMKSSCRSQDIVARWGGDEFVILLKNTSDAKARSICKIIKKKCAKTNNETVPLSISLGYATKEYLHQNIIQTLKRAEDIMYKKKFLESKSVRSSIIGSLKKTLYEKSTETEEHAERLTEYCNIVGKTMKLSSNEINDLHLLSVLHDIGKTAIRDSILKKPGPLTDEEWVEMKRHPEIGYRIAQSVPELSQIAEYILSHHERWDGKGYPQGLRSQNIPLPSRIIAVADAYDAMINDRLYRKALPINIAKQELMTNSGTQFDPLVVNIFLQYAI